MNAAKRIVSAALGACAVLLSIAPGQASAQAPAPPVSPTPVTRFEYDAEGHLTRVIAAPGSLAHSHALARDRLSRAVEWTDPAGGRTRMQHDGIGRLLQVDDPRNLVTRYVRNGLGDMQQLQSPDTGVATHTFDAAGNLLTRTDSRGAVGTFTYDALDRPRTLTYRLAGQPDRPYAWLYDQTGPEFGHGIGQLTTAHFPSGHTTYGYDAWGRTTRTVQRVDAGGGVVALGVAYGHDAAGRLTRITYPSGRVLHIGRLAGRVVSLGLAPDAAQSPLPLLGSIETEPAVGGDGAARSWVWHLNGGGTLAHARVFDTSGRLVRYPLGGALRDVFYDAAERITAYRHFDAATGAATPAAQALDQTFGYDPVGRLTSVATSVGTWGYAYDANGNRTRVDHTVGGTTQVRDYTVATTSNRLLGLSNPARAMTHDAAGNTEADLSAGVGWTAHHDAAGRMAGLSAWGPGGTRTDLDFGHDANGQRVFKRLRGGAGVIFVHDLDGRLLGEYASGTGAVLREYVWLHGTPVAVVDGPPAAPAVYYVHADHIDTPRVVIDRNGAQRWNWMAEPFGNSAPVTNPLGLGPFVLNLRFPGQYFDAESGLSHNWHREYDGAVGRYTQSDPVGLAGGINTYAYVEGDPAASDDPDGLSRRTGSRPVPQTLGPVSTSRTGPRPAQGAPFTLLEPLRIQLGGPSSCGPCLEVYFVATTHGRSASNHRRSANSQFFDSIVASAYSGRVSPQLASQIVQQMSEGRGAFRNPSGGVWHHPINRPGELWLIRQCDHVSPTMQPLLHPLPGRGGGRMQNF